MRIEGVPDAVRKKAVAAGAEAWLTGLPRLVADLERAWSISVGRTLPGATEAFVAEATCHDGTQAVLKLLIPREGNAARNEITVLRLANGSGCARLFRADETRSALLLERLGPSLFELALPLKRRHEILCTAAALLWRPAPESGLRTGASKGEWLIEFASRLWDELGRPCSERAVEYARSCARNRIRAHDDERAVVVHGDVHQWNTLEAAGGFKLVDPDGLLAEAEYDLGILMREDPVELLQGDPHARAHALAERTDLDATAIWEWGAIERVSTGLLCTQIGLQPVGRQMLAAAERVTPG